MPAGSRRSTTMSEKAPIAPGGSPGDTPAPLDLAPELINKQVDRLLESDLLKGSLTLHRLLRFIVQAKIDGRDDEVKESVLATDVFERSPDFDNRVDPVVRVQAHRLRRKLEVYYAGPGADDLIVIQVPKGSYVPDIHARKRTAAASAGPKRTAPPPNPTPREPTAAGRWSAALLVGVAFASLVVGFLMGRSESEPSLQAGPPGKLGALWAPLLSADAAPTSVVFNVPVFLSNEKALLRYSGPYTAPTGAGLVALEDLRRYVDSDLLDLVGPVLFNRTYAYLGQVYQINALTSLFTQAGKSFELRPRRVITPDEGENRNLILLNGSGLELASQTLQHFQMREGSFGYKSEDQPALVNLHPSEGEAAEYTIEFDSQTQERKADYAILAFLPGRRENLTVVYTDGLTTLGNWAAIRAATSEPGVSQLQEKLGGTLPRRFEAIVRADLDEDQLVDFQVIAARER